MYAFANYIKDIYVLFKRQVPPSLLFPFLLLTLLMGIAAGLGKLGVPVNIYNNLAPNHALLMIGGFLGTLITLERVVVLQSHFKLFLPAFNLLSIPLLWLGDWSLAALIQFFTAIGLFIILFRQTRRFNSTPSLLLAIGAFCWIMGQFFLLSTELAASAVPWWMGFFLFTITGERSELGKFLPTPTWATYTLYMLLGMYLIGAILPFHQQAIPFTSVASLGVAIWLIFFDIATLLMRKTGRYRYIGTGLFVGYLWLLLHGLIAFFASSHVFQYDLLIHTFFLGFIFSMIWAHAPIILPLLLGKTTSPFQPLIWLPWALFQISLIGRLGSTWLLLPEWRMHFGHINAYSVLLLFLSMASLIIFRRIAEKRNK